MTLSTERLEEVLRDPTAVPDAQQILDRLPALIRRRRRRMVVARCVAALVLVAAVAGFAVRGGLDTAELFAIQRVAPPVAAEPGLLSAPTLVEVYQPHRSVSVEQVRPGAIDALIITPTMRGA